MKQEIQYHDQFEEQGWEVTVTDTGEKTMTGGRLFKARRFLEDDTFLCTYGDGLADVDLKKLIEFHKSHGKIATITAVRPVSRFGVLDLSTSNAVNQFREKPQADGWINAGFFIFQPEVLEYLNENEALEDSAMTNLVKDSQLGAFQHSGFWQTMDTLREMVLR